MSKIKVCKLKNLYIIKKEDDCDFFYTTNDSFIIPTFNFSALIKFMLVRELLSEKTLQGVLDEYRNSTS